MNEADLRKWHRTMGITLALFLFLQGATGAMLSLEKLLDLHELLGLLRDLHFGGGLPGQVYRVILGLGLMGMATSGTLIYLKIRARTHRK